MTYASISNPLSGSCRTSLILPSSAVATAVLLAACADPQPPVSCSHLPDQTMHVHQDRHIAPCFQDPEMGEITLSVESSDPQVVTAEVVAHVVAIRAIYTGSAMITVTATDPDMLATSASFTVRVPNRPPWRRGRIPDALLFPGRMAVRTISLYFTDPDNQELTYTVESSDPAVVSTSQNLNIVRLYAHDEGSATLTVTATDPLGDTVSQEFMATVRIPDHMLRDDFSTDESFHNWELSRNADATITHGSMRLYNVVAGLLGWAETEVAAGAWEASARMGNATDSVFVSLVAGVDHLRYKAYLLQIGTDDDTFVDLLGRTNYRLFLLDAQRGTWVYRDGWYGMADEIADVGKFTEITLTAQGGDLAVYAQSRELFRVSLDPLHLSDELTYLALASWPKCCETGHAAIVDWVELEGIPVDDVSMGGSGANGDLAGRLPGMGLREAMLSTTVKRFDRDEQVSRASGKRE